MDFRPIDLSVIVPAFNEASLLAHSVSKLEQWISSLEVSWELVLVDDGSNDGTAGIMARLAGDRSRLRLLRLQGHRGRGSALRLGLENALGRVALTTEADDSWDVAGLQTLARLALRGEADVLVASPHLPGGGLSGVPLGRRLLSISASLATRALLGGGLTMSTGMARAYRSQILPRILSDLPGKEFHADVLCRALRLGLKVREVPVKLHWSPERRARRGSIEMGELVRSSIWHLRLLAGYRWSRRQASERTSGA